MNCRQNDPISETLTALDHRLEGIRREHFARNRSALRHLNSEQLLQVEMLTAAIVGQIYHEVASGLRDSVADADGERLSEEVSVMSEVLGLV